MTDRIGQLMAELLDQAPELRGREYQLRGALQELVSSRPQAVMDPAFRAELKRRLLAVRPRARLAWRPFLYPLAGAAIIALVFVAVQDRQSLSPEKATDMALAPDAPSAERSLAGTGTSTNQAPQPQLMMAAKSVQAMKLTSPAFDEEASIPAKYTCDGAGISPPLNIADAPAGTQRFVLIVEDPDAPGRTFLHWIVWNIPGLTASLDEGQLPKGTVQGLNGAGKPGYIGPCPPSGTHHYVFSLYAIDTTLNLPEETTPAELRAAIENNVLEQTTLIGVYQRKQ